MAACGRALALKAALLVGFALLILNVSRDRFSMKFEKFPFHHSNASQSQFSTSSNFGPKRLRSSSDLTINNNNNHTSINKTITGFSNSSVFYSRASYWKKAANDSESIQLAPSISPVQTTSPNSSGRGNRPTISTTISPLNDTATTTVSNEIGNDTQIQATDNINPPPIERQTKAKPNHVNLLNKIMTKLGLNVCPEMPPGLEGNLEVNLTEEPIIDVEMELGPKLEEGGWYKPTDCNAKDRVAIIIPFRNRESHLPVLLKNLHPMLMKQQIEYGIFVVEQTPSGQFNRASLFNIGFIEANKMKKWDCFIFHDVDLIPMNDQNLYNCPEQPRHMSVAVDTFNYKLPYSNIFGGVCALTSEQFESVNGFSNSYWGWGGEDDDMSTRLRFIGYHISRYPVNIARYTMLSHKTGKKNPKRYEKLMGGLKRYLKDGLNSLEYQLRDMQKRPLYTWLYVKLNPELIKEKSNHSEFLFIKICMICLMISLPVCILKFIFF